MTWHESIIQHICTTGVSCSASSARACRDRQSHGFHIQLQLEHDIDAARKQPTYGRDEVGFVMIKQSIAMDQVKVVVVEE